LPAAIVEFSDDAIVGITLDGVIRSWNRAAQRMFEYTEEEAIGQPITIIGLPESYKGEAHVRSRLAVGERIAHYETVRVSKSGKRIDVSLTISPIKDAEGRVIGASKIVRDITERKRAEAAVRESEERFRLVANKAPVIIWMSGVDKLCSYANQQCVEFLGQSVETILGNGWTDCIHSDDLERAWDTYSTAFDRREPFQSQYRFRRHDGEYRWITDTGVPRFNADGSFAGYIGTAVDVTERKLAEEALTTMNRKLIEAHEEERTWIARELHDDINQRVALLALNLEALKHDLPASDGQARNRIEEANKDVQNLASDIQALSHRLHSSKLEYLGLVAASGSLCKELSERQNVEIHFHSNSISKNLPKETSLCLFRVLQEALQNAIKHSGARHFEVSLKEALSEIQLSVHDSGVGFDPEQAMNGGGLGLTSMKERLKLVGGNLFIDSQEQRGTTIQARVPLAHEMKSATTTG